MTVQTIEIEAPEREPRNGKQASARVLEASPLRVNRLAAVVKGAGYIVTWVHVERTVHESTDDKGNVKIHAPPLVNVHRERVVVRDDGTIFTNAPLDGAEPLSKLPAHFECAEPPQEHLLLSGAGVNRFLAGERPDPVEVFDQVFRVVDHFMDFSHSFSDQRTICELLACWTLHTYLLDSFSVTGYLWPNGEAGSGKSHLLYVLSTMAYLGQVVLASSTFATLRDMAGYGATLLFDDAERIMDPKNGDPDKQALLLAGNRKGSMIALKEQIDKKWVTRHVPSYCPRAFSAIGLPIDTMASRTIFIPVVASADARKSNSDPLDYESWPDGIDRDRLIDDLWLTALFHGSKLSAHDRKVAASGSTHGRSFQPWRAIHAVASWLEGEGIEGLRDRMAAAMTAYHGDELLNSMRGGRTIVIRGLSRMVDHRLKTDPTLGENREIVFRTRELVEYVDAVAYEEDLIGKDENYITSRSMGWHLKKMRLRRPSTRSADAREWAVTAQEVAVRRSSLLGQTLGENVTNDRNGRNDTSEAESSDVSAVSDICDVFPGGISMPDELRHKLASFVPKNRMAEVVDNFRDDLDDLAAMPFEQMQTIVLKFLAPTEGASQ